MAKRTIKSKQSRGTGAGGLTTAAGLAKKIGVHKSTISRRAHKKGLASKKRIGHQIMLDRGSQSVLRVGGKRGRPRK